MAHTIADQQNSLMYSSPAMAASSNVDPITSTNIGLSGGGVAPPNPALMLHLIQQYPDLQAKIDQLASRIPIVDTEFNTNDFPTEVSDRLAVISRCDKYAKAISLKDEMLWLSLNEKEKIESKLSKEVSLNKDYSMEINKWADVLQQHVNQLTIIKQEKEKLKSENYQLKELLRKHNIHYVDMTKPMVPPIPPPSSSTSSAMATRTAQLT